MALVAHAVRRDSLCERIDSRVTNAEIRAQKEMVISFDDGWTLSVSREHPTQPEAGELTDRAHWWVWATAKP